MIGWPSRVEPAPYPFGASALSASNVTQLEHGLVVCSAAVVFQQSGRTRRERVVFHFYPMADRRGRSTSPQRRSRPHHHHSASEDDSILNVRHWPLLPSSPTRTRANVGYSRVNSKHSGALFTRQPHNSSVPTSPPTTPLLLTPPIHTATPSPPCGDSPSALRFNDPSSLSPKRTQESSSGATSTPQRLSIAR